jgi:hypothetical protein
VDSKDDKKKDDKEETNKKLPIINPLVRLPSWPSKNIFRAFKLLVLKGAGKI